MKYIKKPAPVDAVKYEGIEAGKAVYSRGKPDAVFLDGFYVGADRLKHVDRERVITVVAPGSMIVRNEAGALSFVPSVDFDAEYEPAKKA